MQILSETKAKAKETLQKRRNLFGLGLTSLIAACGADKAAGDSGDVDEGTPTPTATLPFEAEKAPSAVAASELSGTGEGKSGFTATKGGATPFTVAITGGDNNPTLTFSDGEKDKYNAAKIYKITTTTDQYDLVVSSPTIDNDKGGVFVFWNVAGIENETIGGTSTRTTNQRLEIKGTAADDNIGSAPELLQIGGTVNNYDMVFAGYGIDRVSGSSTNEGAVYILWDVADYAGTTKTIDLDPDKIDDADVGDVLGLGATSGSLIIYGARSNDYIGISYVPPQLLELGGADDNYDMVVRSDLVNGNYKGAIYVLWDVTGYYDTEALHKTVTLDSSLVDASGAYTNGATYGLLSIYGAIASDYVGSYAPDFLQIGGKDDNYDMVIRSQLFDQPGKSTPPYNNHGAIYILWDVADYAGENIGITLDNDLSGEATAGSLAIYGATANDAIGSYAPEFLQIGGADDDYDMVVRSKVANGERGAIYVLWDVADYYDTEALHKTVTLDSSLVDASGAYTNGATYGLLSIYGTNVTDFIGSYAPEFLQIAGKDNNYDMVIRSQDVDKMAGVVSENTGAIYILWDVEDYAGENETINLTSLSSDATSGLLTIYGKEQISVGEVDQLKKGLGHDNNDILYDTDAAGNKTATNIGEGEIKDIVFRDKDYTYILFGDKVATTTGTGVDEKVDSKTIDLAVVHAALGADAAGFFSYDFDGASGGGDPVDRVGYRFADRSHATLAEVQTAYDTATSPAMPLSDTDADLGVWDIA